MTDSVAEVAYDAIVVGSGPNGFAAAITLARAGKRVLIVESADTPGGGLRTEELTLPGFKHDVFSAVHPMAIASPFFRALPLDHYGLEWVHSPAALAHPMGDTAALLESSVAETAAKLGKDGWRYRRVFGPLARNWEALFSEVMRPALHMPKHPYLMARFGMMAMMSAEAFAKGLFRDPKTRAIIGGVGAHANVPIDRSGTASIAIMMMIAAHARGWPIPKGGAKSVASALIAYFLEQGGVIETGFEIRTLGDLPKSKMVFFDLSPSATRSILGKSGLKPLAESIEVGSSGPGVFKLDWALQGPIPWIAPDVARAATVHLGGPIEHVARSEARPIAGEHPKRPFVILSQPSLFDPTRAPEGRHTAWAYCHVPANSTVDMTDAIEEEIERYAPGFRTRILARHKTRTKDLESRNANMIGGSLGGGEFRFWHMLTARGRNPYEISKARGLYLCSAWTPPGPGVHGMCGYNAANAALKSSR